MAESIGTAAGTIWRFLEQNGPASISKISTGTGLNKNEVQRGLGWLAREQKISFDVSGRSETVSLI